MTRTAESAADREVAREAVAAYLPITTTCFPTNVTATMRPQINIIEEGTAQPSCHSTPSSSNQKGEEGLHQQQRQY
ncbi:hypothetical protein Ndes2526B_g03839 [Nannochloris sp. 'desiccata']